MSAHTFGPWVARRVDQQEWEIDAPKGDQTIGYSSWCGLVSVYGCNDFPDAGGAVAEANARLIAAAPELLEACIQAEAAIAGLDFDGCPEALAVIRAAIAKAEGRA